MYKILKSERLAESVTRMAVLAPDVVRRASAGQFVVVIPEENGERIPLTIAGVDTESGGVTLIFQEVGFSTRRLAALKPGERVFSLLGPLGKVRRIEKCGDVACIGGGVGIAEILPVARAYKDAGNRVTGIIGSRTKDLLILREELRAICDELLLATDDGSCGTRGLVTDVLKDELERRPFALVYAVGPVPMMRSVARMTAARGVRTVVSLNPVMVDATGMCGVCRCRVAGKTVFGCVDGPEFDAHAVDFDELEKRLGFFRNEESLVRG